MSVHAPTDINIVRSMAKEVAGTGMYKLDTFISAQGVAQPVASGNQPRSVGPSRPRPQVTVHWIVEPMIYELVLITRFIPRVYHLQGHSS